MDIEEAFQKINALRIEMDLKTQTLQEEQNKISEQISAIIEPYAKEIDYLKNIIQVHVMEDMASAKTAHGVCSYVKGRKGSIRWDDKALMGYAATHEEIIQFRTEGEPGQPSVRWDLPGMDKLRIEKELAELRSMGV